MRDTRKKMPHPMQPIGIDGKGIVRFKENAIIQFLFKSGKLNLNEIACMDFPAEDEMQIAQLLGYSVSGYGDLSYASRKSVAAADAIATELWLLAKSRTVKKRGEE